jgi:hypothetical protein
MTEAGENRKGAKSTKNAKEEKITDVQREIGAFRDCIKQDFFVSLFALSASFAPLRFNRLADLWRLHE